MPSSSFVASQIYAVTGADPSEPPKNEPTENDAFELQQTVATQPTPDSENTVSALPTEPIESFESRWSGLQRSESGVEFSARWALDSQ